MPWSFLGSCSRKLATSTEAIWNVLLLRSLWWMDQWTCVLRSPGFRRLPGKTNKRSARALPLGKCMCNVCHAEVVWLLIDRLGPRVTVGEIWRAASGYDLRRRRLTDRNRHELTYYLYVVQKQIWLWTLMAKVTDTMCGWLVERVRTIKARVRIQSKYVLSVWRRPVIVLLAETMVACHTESKAWRKREKSWHREVVDIAK